MRLNLYARDADGLLVAVALLRRRFGLPIASLS
jgi:hypothetical protein